MWMKYSRNEENKSDIFRCLEKHIRSSKAIVQRWKLGDMDSEAIFWKMMIFLESGKMKR